MSSKATKSPVAASLRGVKRAADTPTASETQPNPDDARYHKHQKVSQQISCVRPSSQTHKTQSGACKPQAVAPPNSKQQAGSAAHVGLHAHSPTAAPQAASLPSGGSQRTDPGTSLAAPGATCAPARPQRKAGLAAKRSLASLAAADQNRGHLKAARIAGPDLISKTNTPKSRAALQDPTDAGTSASTRSEQQHEKKTAAVQSRRPCSKKCLPVQHMPAQSANKHQQVQQHCLTTPQPVAPVGAPASLPGTSPESSTVTEQLHVTASHRNNRDAASCQFRHGTHLVQQLSPNTLACCISAYNAQSDCAQWWLPAGVPQNFFKGLDVPVTCESPKLQLFVTQADGIKLPVTITCRLPSKSYKKPRNIISGLTSYRNKHQLQAGDLIVITRSQGTKDFSITHQKSQQYQAAACSTHSQQTHDAVLQQHKGRYPPSMHLIDVDHMTWTIPRNKMRCILARAMLCNVFCDLQSQLPSAVHDPHCRFDLTEQDGSCVSVAISRHKTRPTYQLNGICQYIRKHSLQVGDVIFITRTACKQFSISHKLQRSADPSSTEADAHIARPANAAPVMVSSQSQPEIEPPVPSSGPNIQSDSHQEGQAHTLLTAASPSGPDVQKAEGQVCQAGTAPQHAHPPCSKSPAQPSSLLQDDAAPIPDDLGTCPDDPSGCMQRCGQPTNNADQPHVMGLTRQLPSQCRQQQQPQHTVTQADTPADRATQVEVDDAAATGCQAFQPEVQYATSTQATAGALQQAVEEEIPAVPGATIASNPRHDLQSASQAVIGCQEMNAGQMHPSVPDPQDSHPQLATIKPAPATNTSGWQHGQQHQNVACDDMQDDQFNIEQADVMHQRRIICNSTSQGKDNAFYVLTDSTRLTAQQPLPCITQQRQDAMPHSCQQQPTQTATTQAQPGINCEMPGMNAVPADTPQPHPTISFQAGTTHKCLADAAHSTHQHISPTIYELTAPNRPGTIPTVQPRQQNCMQHHTRGLQSDVDHVQRVPRLTSIIKPEPLIGTFVMQHHKEREIPVKPMQSGGLTQLHADDIAVDHQNAVLKGPTQSAAENARHIHSAVQPSCPNVNYIDTSDDENEAAQNQYLSQPAALYSQQQPIRSSDQAARVDTSTAKLEEATNLTVEPQTVDRQVASASAYVYQSRFTPSHIPDPAEGRLPTSPLVVLPDQSAEVAAGFPSELAEQVTAEPGLTAHHAAAPTEFGTAAHQHVFHPLQPPSPSALIPSATGCIPSADVPHSLTAVSLPLPRTSQPKDDMLHAAVCDIAKPQVGATNAYATVMDLNAVHAHAHVPCQNASKSLQSLVHVTEDTQSAQVVNNSSLQASRMQSALTAHGQMARVHLPPASATRSNPQQQEAQNNPPVVAATTGMPSIFHQLHHCEPSLAGQAPQDAAAPPQCTAAQSSLPVGTSALMAPASAPFVAQTQPKRSSDKPAGLPDITGLTGVARQAALEQGLDMALAAVSAGETARQTVGDAMCYMSGDVERLKAFVEWQYPCIMTSYASRNTQRLRLCLKQVFSLAELP